VAYVMAPSIAETVTVGLVNNRFGRDGEGNFCGLISGGCLENEENNRNLRIICVLVEIQTVHPWDTSQKRYRLNHRCRFQHFILSTCQNLTNKENLNTLVSIRVASWPEVYEISSPTQTLGSGVRIPLEAWMYVCVFFRVCVSLYR
jgi:hypothetical protein